MRILIRADQKNNTLQTDINVSNQRKQQRIFIVLFSAFYLLRDLVGLNLPDIVFSSLCAVAFLYTDMGTSMGIYIFTTDLTVPHNEIAVAYLIITVLKILSSDKVKMSSGMLIMNLGLLFIQLLNMALFSADAVGSVIYSYITKMLIIIMPLLWYNDEFSAEDFQSALLCYVAGVVLGGTVTLILTAERVTWEVLIKGTGNSRLGRTWSTDEGMQTSYNANQLGGMFSIITAIVLNYLLQKRMSKLLGIGLIGYALFIIVLTRSRSAILLIAMVFLVCVAIIAVRKKKVMMAFSLLIIFVAAFYFMAYFFPGMTQKLIDRFVGEDDITNGRIDLFIYFLQQWANDLWCFLFGYGIGSFHDVLGTRAAPHNSITDILISCGLMGLFLIFGIVGMCYKKGNKPLNKKDRIMALLPAMVALVASLAGQYLETAYPHPRLCFLLLAAPAFAEKEQSAEDQPMKE